MGMNSYTPTPEKDRFVDAAFSHAVFDGWLDSTLEKAASDTGTIYALVREWFPAGVADVLAYHSARADAQMVEALKANAEFSTLKIRERIFTAVMTRLNAHVHEREAIRRATAFYAMPWNAAAGLKALYATMDAMWRAAGDTSTDYNFYTKRLTLANVYGLTLKVWLDDESDAQEETQAYLRRRIENVMQFEKAKAKCKEQFASMKDWLPDFPRRAG